MTSLERAKKFLSQKSRVIAVSIAPLAALAVPHTAMATNGFTTGVCSVTGNNATSVSSGGCTEQSDGLDPTSNLVGVKILDSNAFDPAFSDIGSGGSGGFGLTLNANGNISAGSYTGTIPVYWNFTPSDTNGGQISYTLTYTIISGACQQPAEGQSTCGTSTQRQETNSVSSGTQVTGTDSFVFSNSFLTAWSVSLQLSEAAGTSGDQLSVHIPSSSIDVAYTVAQTPEPASLVLLGTGLLAFGAFKRKKK